MESPKPEPSPFERFRMMAGWVVSVPKEKADKEERRMREERTGAKRGPKPRKAA